MNSLLSGLIFLTSIGTACAQTHTCPVMVSRNNSNGNGNSCPGVNGTPIASSVSGTSYNTMPAGNKTADITMKEGTTDPWYTNPPAILAVYTTSNGTSTSINTYPGPPGVPASGNVKYCSYTGPSGNGNMPNAGIITIRYATPTNTSDYLICSYDFSNANALVANPSTVVALPVHFYSFSTTLANRSVSISWEAGRDRNTHTFTVERSVNGTDFSDMAYLPAGMPAETGDVASYQYQDYTAGELTAAHIYYRIRETDYSGAVTYSSVSTVKMTDTDQLPGISLLGNTVLVNSESAQAILQYIGIDGRLVKEEKISVPNGTTRLALADVTGAAFLRLITGMHTAVCRL